MKTYKLFFLALIFTLSVALSPQAATDRAYAFLRNHSIEYDGETPLCSKNSKYYYCTNSVSLRDYNQNYLKAAISSLRMRTKRMLITYILDQNKIKFKNIEAAANALDDLSEASDSFKFIGLEHITDLSNKTLFCVCLLPIDDANGAVSEAVNAKQFARQAH